MAEKVTRSSPVLAAVLTGAVRGSSRLSLASARRCGRLLGWLLWRLPNQFRENSRRNVARCFPELTSDEQRQIVRRSLISTALTVTEAGAMFHWPEARLRALEEEVEGFGIVSEGLARGKGVIALGPHVGNWEFLSHAVTFRQPMVCLYRRPRLAELDEYLRRSRERFGSELVPAGPNALRRLARTLAGGGMVGILPDQEPLKRHGVFAPFFGIDALTMTLVGSLAQRFDSVVVLGVAVRSDRGGFRVLIQAGSPAIRDPDPVRAATALNASVEALVRAHPDQYTWSYRRFRTRPPAELAARAGDGDSS